jgi:hypothetical protein
MFAGVDVKARRGAIGHALERVFLLFAEHAGFRWYRSFPPIPYPVPRPCLKKIIRDSILLEQYPQSDRNTPEFDRNIEFFLDGGFAAPRNIPNISTWGLFEIWCYLLRSHRFAAECRLSPFLPFLVLDEILGRKGENT